MLSEHNEIKEEKKIYAIYCIKTMETYCVSCKKNTENKNSSVRKSKQNGLMRWSNCAVCGKNKSTFIKTKEPHNFND